MTDDTGKTSDTPKSSVRRMALELLMEWDQRKRVRMEDLVDERLRRSQLTKPDRGFLCQLCYGAIRRRNTLRDLSDHFTMKPIQEYDRSLRMALSLGIFQWVYLQTPAHALVNETIEAWQELTPRKQWKAGSGLLNAVLRRITREVVTASADEAGGPNSIHAGDRWVFVPDLKLPKDNLHVQLGFQYSHPPEMVRVWLERFELDDLVELLKQNNEIPSTFLVVRATENPEVFLRKLQATGINAEATAEERVIRVTSGGEVAALPGYDEGSFWVQDLTAFRIASLMPVREGASLLDLCAAPGGKLAVLMERGPSEVLACDIQEDKLRRLAENMERLNFDLRKIEVMEVDEDPQRVRLEKTYDQILVDAPCSNTGVLARRHEARWRLLPEALRTLQRTQIELLRTAARTLAPRGDLLYSTCSIEPQENSEVVHDVLRATPELRLIEEIEFLPGPDGDGGYGALFKRV